MGFSFDDIPDQTGRVAVITGGNAGIGVICSQELAKRGGQVFVLTRSEQRYQSAFDEFKKIDPEAAKRWSFVQCNLADLESVKAAAQTVLDKTDRIDLLLNNAGVMAMPYEKTKQGLEIQVGTNVVGHALLSYLLLPSIISTARNTSDHCVRVVQVSSAAHTMFNGNIEGMGWKDLDEVNYSFEKTYGATWKRYCKSKIGNILLANELAKLTEGENVEHVSLHPGAINTGLTMNLDRSYGIIGTLFRRFFSFFLTTPAKGALSSLYAATTNEKINGVYLDPLAVVGKKKPWAEDEEGKRGKEMIDFIQKFCKESVDVDIKQDAQKALAK